MNFKPPADVAHAAKKGLAFRSAFNRGGTSVGLMRGKQLARRDTLTPRDIKSMYAYFARHEVDKKGKNFGNEEKPSNGYIAWLLWGGEPGKRWATKLRNEMKKQNAQ